MKSSTEIVNIGDDSNLYLEFRRRIKNEIEMPEERNWETFKRALELYNKHRNTGFTDEEWTNLGYPIKAPTAEEWFG